MLTTITRMACTLVLTAMLSQAAIAAKRSYYIPPMPKDFSQVDMYLHTVGVGQPIYSRWGHTGIRVRDHLARTDYTFDWGVFDDSDPLFLFHFIRNVLHYQMVGLPTRIKMRFYQYERRDVWQDRLNLTDQQKRSLMERIIWQAQPENRFYRYFQFTQNCATKPRDYIDSALGEALAPRFKGVSAQTSYLAEIYIALQDMPYLAAMLDILSNANLNRTISVWEQMYRPEALRTHLLTAPAMTDTGEMRNGQMLLTDPVQLLEFPPPVAPFPLGGFTLLFIPLMLPIALASFLAIVKAAPVWRLRALGLAAILWGLFAGGFGSLSAVFWLVTEQFDGYHNANLWLLWPFDLVYVWVGGRWLFRAVPLTSDSMSGKVTHLLAKAHLITIPVYVLLNIAGWLDQHVSEFQGYFCPLAILVHFLVMQQTHPRAAEVEHE